MLEKKRKLSARQIVFFQYLNFYYFLKILYNKVYQTSDYSTDWNC